MFFRCHFLNAKSPCRSHFCERQRLFAVRIQLGLGRWNNTLLLLGQCPPSRFLTAPGCCSGTLPLYSGTHHFSLSAISSFLPAITPTSIGARDIGTVLHIYIEVCVLSQDKRFKQHPKTASRKYSILIGTAFRKNTTQAHL